MIAMNNLEQAIETLPGAGGGAPPQGMKNINGAHKLLVQDASAMQKAQAEIDKTPAAGDQDILARFDPLGSFDERLTQALAQQIDGEFRLVYLRDSTHA